MGKTYTRIGVLFSVLYCIGIGVLVYVRRAQLGDLKLNEIGDFLAGGFGPIAILWLVLGYFQQGIELRINSDALKLQADELAHSVEQQRELVKVAQAKYQSDRESLEHQMKVFAQEQATVAAAAMPRFKLNFGGMHSGDSRHDFQFVNYGAACTDLRLMPEDVDLEFSPDSIPLVRTGETAKFSCRLPRVPPIESGHVRLTFNDARGVPGQYRYTLRLDAGDGHHNAKLDLIEQ